MQHLIDLCLHHVLHLWQTLSCSDWSPQPLPNSQHISNGVMGDAMIIGKKNKFSIERLVILSAFRNKGEINDRVA